MEHHIKLGHCGAEPYLQPVRLPVIDRRRHLLITGQTGSGKTTLIANLFAQDANSGRGALLIDPHGDLARQALDLVPRQRIRKTLYLNPSDTEWPVGFNVLDGVPPGQRANRASELIDAFRAIWGDSWGPQLEHILYNAIATLLEVPGTSLLGIRRLLTSAPYRRKILAKVDNAYLMEFWRADFPLYQKVDRAFTPVLNKVGQLLASPVIRNILCQSKSAFHPRHLMDNNYLVIANLAKGKLGPDHAKFLGMFLISAFGSAAMSRADIDEEDRKDFSLMIDEFQNYTTKAFHDLLAEARKFRISLQLGHQHLDQIPIELQKSLSGNVGSMITFRLGARDAPFFELEHAEVSAEQLKNTPRHHAWARILLDGERTYSSILMRTLPPPRTHGHADTIIRHCQQHYGTPRTEIEDRIARFLANGTETETEPAW